MNVLNLLAYFYYMTVMAWAFYYLVVSFQSVVPWSICTGWWNTPNCTTISDTYNKSLFTDNTSSGMFNKSTHTNRHIHAHARAHKHTHQTHTHFCTCLILLVYGPVRDCVTGTDKC